MTIDKRIVKAEMAAKKAEEARWKTIMSVQKRCKHDSAYVYEAEYLRPTEFSYASPPYRVCSKCGLAEVGWGIGWHILPETKLRIDRSDADDIVRYTICEEEKCGIVNGRKRLHWTKLRDDAEDSKQERVD